MASSTPKVYLLIVVADEAEGDGAPEEAGAHLDGQVALVVGVPDPDVAAILDHAGGGGLHAQCFEDAERGFDLLAAFDLHGYWHNAHGVKDRDDKVVSQGDGLRGSIEDSGEQVGEAGGRGGFNVLGLLCAQVFLVEDGAVLGV